MVNADAGEYTEDVPMVGHEPRNPPYVIETEQKAQTPPLVETLAGVFGLCISSQKVNGPDVQHITECEKNVCFWKTYASFIATKPSPW